jgi:hypothetical protein
MLNNFIPLTVKGPLSRRPGAEPEQVRDALAGFNARGWLLHLQKQQGQGQGEQQVKQQQPFPTALCPQVVRVAGVLSRDAIDRRTRAALAQALGDVVRPALADPANGYPAAAELVALLPPLPPPAVGPEKGAEELVLGEEGGEAGIRH